MPRDRAPTASHPPPFLRHPPPFLRDPPPFLCDTPPYLSHTPPFLPHAPPSGNRPAFLPDNPLNLRRTDRISLMDKHTPHWDAVMDAIVWDKLEELPGFLQTVPDFPQGRDDFIHRHWIRNAIDSGSPETVRWMLENGADVNYKDDEGLPALIAALDRDGDDRYEVLAMLIEFGADVNVQSENVQATNDWTPAHLAAIKNDVTALKLLHEAGANLSLRTRIDRYETPLEEARRRGGSEDAVAYLESLGLS
jgi:ankyrin repeat protein